MATERATAIDAGAIAAHVDGVWAADVVPALEEFIGIPNKSPGFDPEWREHGHMDRATELVADWCRARAIPGLRVEIVRIAGPDGLDLTPVVLAEIPSSEGAADAGTVLLYGHLDKQPEMVGWRDGLGPWTPVREGDRLYGRGGADDGYAAFAALTAIEALHAAGGRHARCVVLIEASEESGSPDLPAYVEALAERIGQPDLVVCLDSWCANYEQLWITTSLRGLLTVNLTVRVLDEGVHSGSAGGIVPSSFRIARQLLSRLEDESSGRILLPELHVEVPPGRVAQAEAAGKELGPLAGHEYPFAGGTHPLSADPVEHVLDVSWRPTLAVIGAAGLPAPTDAGNVLLPVTTLQLSVRLPPRCDPVRAADAIERALTTDPPQGATVTAVTEESAAGWDAPPLVPWLEDALEDASSACFGDSPRYLGEGGTIPFMAMLGERFPDAQFVITGVLGPGSNAHGPNEFLDLPTARRVTRCVAHLLHDHAHRG
jgi:acetylornithine deacetylase/succinyl-diaminopimelate desuccinylase-like protein